MTTPSTDPSTGSDTPVIVASPTAPETPASPLAAAASCPGPRDRILTVARVAKLAEDAGLELYRSNAGEAIVASPDGAAYPIRSAAVRRDLSRLVYRELGRPMKAIEFDEILPVLEATAINDGKTMATAVRYHYTAEAGYLDLANGSGQVIKITKDGWHPIPAKDAPVRFARPDGTEPLPMPVRGGAISELRSLLNVSSDAEWALVVAFILGCLGPPPYIGFFVNGPQSSAKSSLCRFVRKVLDPRRGGLRRPPNRESDLGPAVERNFILALDNVSEIKPWLADNLCTISTGGAIATRRLYTDSDEVIVEASRPILANGIPDLTDRPDLQDRVVCIRLAPLPLGARRTEAELGEQFASVHPRVLGAFLDAAVTAMRDHRTCVTTAEVRNVDAHRWCVSAEAHFGVPSGTLEAAMTESRDDAAAEAIESSSVAAALIKLLSTKGTTFVGTQTRLLKELEIVIGRRPHDWPANPRALRGQLNRLEASLSAVGIRVDFGDRKSNKRHRRDVTVELVPSASAVQPDASSSSSADQPNGGPPPVTSSFASLAGVIGEEYDEAYRRARPWR